MPRYLSLTCGLCLALTGLTGCNNNVSSNKTASVTKSATDNPVTSTRVVLYCSVDDVYARPLVKQLEAKTGLRIDTLYDTEASKTAGLANRIRAERSRPQGDVFWSSALLQTLLLNREGLLQTYKSPSAKDIPAAFKASDGSWTGLGARSRVLVYREGLPNPPKSLQDLAAPRFRGKFGVSNPQFGTASDEAAALATRLGLKPALSLYATLKANDVKVMPGNSVVAENVARGGLLVGTTDTDDFLAQQKEVGGLKMATYGVTVPGSVAILKNAPHPEAAKKLVDALLEAESERAFAAAMPGVTSLRDQNALPKDTPNDTAQWPASWDQIRDPLAEILLKP